MKKQMIALCGVAAIGLAGLVGGAAITSAEAQNSKAPVILILNQAEVFGKTKAGQSIAPQLEKLQEAANAELNAKVAKLTKDAEDLKKQRELLSEDVFTKRAQELAIIQNQLPAERDLKVRELSISEQQARGEVFEAMKPILKEIVEANGATLLLERSAVMYASDDTDITAQVISRLDKKLKSVKVEKTDLRELQRQAIAEQQKNAGKKKKKK